MGNLILPAPDQSIAFSSNAVAPVPTTLDWYHLVVDPIMNFLIGVSSFIPDIITALCILFTGWIIGRTLQFFVSFFLRHIGFDKFAARVGISKLLDEGGEKNIPHRWFGSLTLWIVMLVSFVLSLDQLRLRIASTELDRFLHFIVMIFIGLIIAVFGMFLSFVCGRIVLAIAENIHVKRPEFYATIVRWGVLVFTFLACLIEIGLPSQIILVAVGLVSLTLCVTFVLCFGFGGVGWAGKVLDRTLQDDKKVSRT